MITRQHQATATLVKYVRKKRKESLRAFAQRVNLHFTTIRDYENAKKGPSAQSMNRIVHASGAASLDDLIREACEVLALQPTTETETLAPKALRHPEHRVFDGQEDLEQMTTADLDNLRIHHATWAGRRVKAIARKQARLDNQKVQSEVSQKVFQQLQQQQNKLEEMRTTLKENACSSSSITFSSRVVATANRELSAHEPSSFALTSGEISLRQQAIHDLSRDVEHRRQLVEKIEMELARRENSSQEKPMPAPTTAKAPDASPATPPEEPKHPGVGPPSQRTYKPPIGIPETVLIDEANRLIHPANTEDEEASPNRKSVTVLSAPESGLAEGV